MLETEKQDPQPTTPSPSNPIDYAAFQVTAPKVRSNAEFPPLGGTKKSTKKKRQSKPPVSMSVSEEIAHLESKSVLSLEEKDKLMALQLAAQFQNEELATRPAPQQPQHSEEDDLVMAMRLQAQLNAEARQGATPADRSYQNGKSKKKRRGRNKKKNTTTFYINSGGTFGDSNANRGNAANLRASKDENDDPDYDEDFENEFNNPHMPHEKLAHQFKVLTKHSAIFAGMENASKLDEYQTGAGDIGNLTMDNTAYNALRETTKRTEVDAGRARMNKQSRAAHDSVIDQATRMVLYRYLNTDFLREINGIVSVGKEAHVYHGISGDPTPHPLLIDNEIYEGTELAIKIYHKDMRGFKDRAMYYDSGKLNQGKRNISNSNNASKLIKMWAEKEMRNLTLMYKNGILCPKPIVVRNNVVIMQFLGKQSVAAPRLKDVELSDDKLHELYLQTVQMMRKMYQVCDLVHADLSEYNILYHRGKVWFIDVSQSVTTSQENAQEFLERDCQVITSFFIKNGVVNAMDADLLQEFITSTDITRENMDEWLENAQQQNDSQSDGGDEEEEGTES